jgi:hypothetical protein
MRHACVAAVWAGIRRTLGTAQQQKAPLAVVDLRRICEDAPANPTKSNARSRGKARTSQVCKSLAAKTFF